MKKLLIILGSIALILAIVFLILDEDLPQGEKGAKAEELTDKMFDRLNKTAWDSLPLIRWSFRGEHRYIWGKRNNLARIAWSDYKVFMDLNNVTGKAYKNGVLLEGDEADKTLEKAWSFWCNDSFWLIAPFKARDPGTTRKYVKLEDGLDGLLVQYESGGVTPGDAYLWALDSEGIPQYYKMWVSIIPIGGVKATWSEWKEFEGVMISTEHKMGPMEIPVTDIKAGNTLQDIGSEENLFSSLSY
jgi:hypothetical protein